MSKALQAALKETASAAIALNAALERVDDARKNLTILCGCGKRHKIGDLKLIVTHWYVSPHGCTGGDYYNEGEWQYLCPKDNVRERLLFDNYRVPYEYRYEREYNPEQLFKSAYRGLFMETVETHEDAEERAISPFHRNNYFIDRNLKYFGINPKEAPRP